MPSNRVQRRLAVSSVVMLFACNSVALAQPRQTPPGEGVVCMWAITTALSEVGRRCYPGQYVEAQRALTDAVARIDAYVLQNADPTPTQDQIDGFKRQQGSMDSTDAELCSGEANRFYVSFVEQGADAITQSVDGLLARPGPPTWGSCL